MKKRATLKQILKTYVEDFVPCLAYLVLVEYVVVKKEIP